MAASSADRTARVWICVASEGVVYQLGYCSESLFPPLIFPPPKCQRVQYDRMFLMIIIQRKHDLLNYLWMIVRISPAPNSTPCLVHTLARGATRYIQCDSVMKNSDCGLRLPRFKSRSFPDRQWESIQLGLFQPSVTRGQ